MSFLPSKETTVTLSLYLNSKLEQYFPNDPYSDITIIFCSKNYKLQKAYLRLESDYFAESFESETASSKLLLIGKKFEVGLFEKILRCFYGGKAIIYLNEIYTAFEICQYLKSSTLIAQMVEQLVKNFENLNFFMVYSIGYSYFNDELLEKCFNFLKETNFKALMEEWVYASKPNHKYPNSICALSEDSFKNLIKMHNQLKVNSSRLSGFLTYLEIYNIIKAYVSNNCTVNLKELVLELIDRNQLNSKEYKLIYHQELFLLDDEKGQINNINNDYKNEQKYLKMGDSSKLEMITSENFLFRKEMEELRNDNTILLEELKILKENFKKSQHNISQYEEKYNELVNKFNEIKNDINKNQIKNEMRFYDLELIVHEISGVINKNKEINNNFQRTSSDKTTACSNKFKKNTNFERFTHPINRKSIEVTKASRTENLFFHTNEPLMVQTLKGKINENDDAKHYLSAESFLRGKKTMNLEENTKPTYSILKQKTVENRNSNKNIDDLMQNICVEGKEKEEFTQESFYIVEKNQMNNTIMSNYSQIIDANILTDSYNYQTNYKNTVLFDVKSEILLEDSDFETLKKWFDIKLFQKLKLQLLYKGSKDGFSSKNLKEKNQGNIPKIAFFRTIEVENQVFGGFFGAHSNQGFVFEVKKRIRIDYSIKYEENEESLMGFGEFVKILNDGDKHKRNVMKRKLIEGDGEEEVNFRVGEIEIYKTLIDSEMDL